MLLKNRPVSPALPAMIVVACGLTLGLGGIRADAQPTDAIFVQPVQPPTSQPDDASAAPAAVPSPDLNAPDLPDLDATAPASPEADETGNGLPAQAPEADVECLAKIIQHEAANQSEAVQLAVAHVVLNRLASKRFPTSICGIAMQPGQFFDVRTYRPYNDRRWNNSLRIARDAIAGVGQDNAPGALFFRTASYKSNFFRSRPQVAVLGNMAFHR